MSVVNGQFTRTNSFGAGVERSYPRFFIEAVEDQLASSHAGRRIFRDEERVEIIMPGNPYARPVQRVTDAHRRQWPKEYEAFKAGQELAPEGTPLEEWPRLKLLFLRLRLSGLWIRLWLRSLLRLRAVFQLRLCPVWLLQPGLWGRLLHRASLRP